MMAQEVKCSLKPREDLNLINNTPTTKSQSPSQTDNTASLITLLFEVKIVDQSKGRGLFAAQDLEPHSLIHVAPCIFITSSEYESHMRHTILEHYLFNCPGSKTKLLALGYGSLFNHHSQNPNVTYKVDPQKLEISYRVGYKPIHKGEELFISYGARNLWFEDSNTDTIMPQYTNNSEDEDDESSSFISHIDPTIYE